MINTQRRTTGILALALGIVCWGVTPVLIRRLTPFVDAWTANGLRYPISAILYWPVLYFMVRSGRLSRDLVRRCLVPAVLSTSGQVFWSLAHYELQASEIGFFARMSSAWAILGSVILFHDERRLLKTPKFLAGVAIVAIGFLVMSMRTTESPSSHQLAEPIRQSGEAIAIGPPVENFPSARESEFSPGNYPLGVFFALSASCFFGLYMVSIRWCVPKENPIDVFAVVGQLVSISMIAGMFFGGDPASVSQQTPFSWSLIVGSSILGIGVGHVLVYTAVQRLGASITTSCQSVLPFATVAAASVLLSEHLTMQQWCGGVMMVVGALLLLSIKHQLDH